MTTKDLCKFYKNGAKEVRAVDGVTIEVQRGEAIAIVGPSGAGKSTLLHLMGGLDHPTAGSVILGGVDIYHAPDIERARMRNSKIGFVFQFYHLLPEFSALENVMLPGLMGGAGRGTRHEIRKRAANALESVGLGERLKHKPTELSGGESQRVAIARALVNEPQILLCDEPTGNLDSKTSQSVYELLSNIKIRSGMSLVIVTHDEKAASDISNVLHIRDGRIV